jgi:hypothetical protein
MLFRVERTTFIYWPIECTIILVTWPFLWGGGRYPTLGIF